MSDGEEEDPFDVFGDESDDDSDGGSGKNEGKDSIAIARSLVQAANKKIGIPAATPRTSSHSAAATTTSSQDEDKGLQDLSHLFEWKNEWPDPMYKGKILLVNLSFYLIIITS